MELLAIHKAEWDKVLGKLLPSFAIYASVGNEFGQDYEILEPSNIPNISYNTPKPTTPLKSFFLPVKENVTADQIFDKPRIIMGVPNCDLEGLNILDEIYLDKDFTDRYYLNRRKNTTIITTDCFTIQDHCHCVIYGITPYSETGTDISIVLLNDTIIFKVFSKKGDEFIKALRNLTNLQILQDSDLVQINAKHLEISQILKDVHKNLPDYKKTTQLLAQSGQEIWKKYSAHCVSCGACATICPTCSCFLLIDKPDFGKVKQMDACQYPGFERVAGGEDVLHKMKNRFRNRYFCKYVWKPEKFKSLACTGCGRCIDACIGKINKNELFIELAN